jgi:sialate O-acetylesterase
MQDMLRFAARGCVLAAAVLLVAAARAEVRLPALFSDHMVLQRDSRIPVWGWAEDGEQVTVRFQGQERIAETTDGRWRVLLDPVPAGGPFEMTVTGKNTLVVRDILVGENWICGGQSNMAMAVNRAANAAEAIAGADLPQIRLFKVKVTGADSPQEDVEAEWVVCTPETVPEFSAVGFFFGRGLQQHLKTPVGLIQACLGGTNASCWTTRETLAADPALKSFLDEYEQALVDFPEAQARYETALAQHQERLAEAKAAGRELTPAERRAPREPMGPSHVKRPAALYNAMIAPLQPFAVRGAIWYQGEANAHSVAAAEQYRTLFPAMINDWRQGWGQPRFPFLFVQLAAYADNPAWPLLRDVQTEALKLPDTGMAVAIDVGERKDIHPTDKETVGQRLVMAARNVAYGEEVPPTGPLFHEMEIRDNLAIVTFRFAANGLKSTAKPITGFQVAGADGNFVPAEAAIAGMNVLVKADGVDKPVAVRYGWQAFPDPPCSLYNHEGLPAVPFRTDDYPVGE